MKKKYFLLILLTLFSVFVACKEEEEEEPPLDNNPSNSSLPGVIDLISNEKAIDSLRIQVLYFRGGQDTTTDRMYLKDKFFQIYNPTNVPVPIANLAILEAQLLTVKDYLNLTVEPASGFLVGAAFKVPSSDTTMLKPKGKLVFCSVGKDHAKFSNPGLNHTLADFEWFEDITHPNPNVFSEDTPVPNLDRLYSYSKTIWTPHGQGFKSYAIAYLPEAALDSIIYEYDINLWNSHMGDSLIYHFKLPTTVIHPNRIIDAVNIVGNNNVFRFNPFPTILDQGYAVIRNPLHSNYGVAIVRKDYVDTNNSSEDFKEINLNFPDESGNPITDPRDPRLKSKK